MRFDGQHYFDSLRRQRGVLRNRLHILQRSRCYLCGEPFTRDAPPTFEHVKPRRLGGQDRRNRLLAHAPCNLTKGDRAPHPCELIFLAAINARLAVGA